MRLAILSESPADEAAVRILAGAVLGTPIEAIDLRARPGGWAPVLRVLPGIIRGVHYRALAEGIIVVIDSNHSPLHADYPDVPCDEPKCRLCRTRECVSRVCQSLSPLANRSPIRCAIGLAVPAVEAWYLCGRDPNVSEAAWRAGFDAHQWPYTKQQLKQRVYGADRPTLAVEAKIAITEARRLAADLTLLREKFPVGFGSLCRQLDAWSSGHVSGP